MTKKLILSLFNTLFLYQEAPHHLDEVQGFWTRSNKGETAIIAKCQSLEYLQKLYKKVKNIPIAAYYETNASSGKYLPENYCSVCRWVHGILINPIVSQNILNNIVRNEAIHKEHRVLALYLVYKQGEKLPISKEDIKPLFEKFFLSDEYRKYYLDARKYYSKTLIPESKSDAQSRIIILRYPLTC